MIVPTADDKESQYLLTEEYENQEVILKEEKKFTYREEEIPDCECIYG